MSAPRTRASMPPWAYVLAGALGGLAAGTLIYLSGVLPPRPAPRAAKPSVAIPRHFDFYTILPDKERLLPEQTARAPRAAKPAGVAKAAPPVGVGRYVLQAASFGTYSEADALKARLALSGFEAHIERITLGGKGQFYRVRLGPYPTLGQLDSSYERLRALGIHALKLELKPGA